MDKTDFTEVSNKFIGKPSNMVKSWSTGPNCVLFQLDDESMWMHGQLFDKNNLLDPNSKFIPRTEPIKLEWTGTIVHSDHYIVFKKDGFYYVVGSIPWQKQGTYSLDPVKIDIDGIIKVFTRYNCIYVCTKDECFVAGSNNYGQLGINDRSIKWQPTFKKVDWYPVYIDTRDTHTTDIKLTNGKWYGIGLIDEMNGYHYEESFVEPFCTEEEWYKKTDKLDKYGYPVPNISGDDRYLWYPRELSSTCDTNNEYYDNEYLNNDNCEYNNEEYLCRRCKFDVIDINYMPKNHNDGTYRRYCLLCLNDIVILKGKDKERAIFNLKCSYLRDFPKIQDFLIDEFKDLQDDLKDFSKMLTEFTMDDLIDAVTFENRLLVKRLIHDKLLEYFHPNFLDVRLLKENNYASDDVPLEPNDLGYLDWRSCDICHKMDYLDLINKVKNKDKVKVLNMWNSSHLRDNLDTFYEFVTNLPNLEVLIVETNLAENPKLKKFATLKNIRFIRAIPCGFYRTRLNEVQSTMDHLFGKFVFDEQTKKVQKYNKYMDQYQYGYFPNYPKHYMEKE